MKLLPGVQDILDSKNLQGKNRPQSRVTVEPDWMLHQTGKVNGSNTKGPLRWWQRADGSQEEVEIPNIKSVRANWSIDQDVASCEITIYNSYTNAPDAVQFEGVGGFGRPGYFWPKHAANPEAVSRWNQLENEWADILVPNALIRYYFGYGNYENDGTPKSIADGLATGNLALKGVWRVDKVVAGTNGLLILQCRDIGSILLDQNVYPPVIPSDIYPLEYYPPGTSPYTVGFGAQNTTIERLLGVRNVNLTYANSSSDERAGAPGSNTPVHNHRPSDAVDGNSEAFSLSDGYEISSGAVWWEFSAPGSIINQITLEAWRGPYTAHISIMENGAWIAAGGLAPGSNVPYMIKMGLYQDYPQKVDLGRNVKAEKIRVTLTDLYQSPFGPNYFRAGLREIRAGYQTSATDGEAVFEHAWGLGRCATGGYWVLDSSMGVYGFGGARQYGENASSIRGQQQYGIDEAIKIIGTPSGQGYFILNRNGAVRTFGDAVWHGDNVSNSSHILVTKGAVDLAVTHTGNGYWIFHSNGAVYNFGDAPSFNADPTQDLCPKTPGIALMEAAGYYAENSRTVTAAVAHPSGYGWWAINGNGEIAGRRGAAADFGGISGRPGFRNTEYCSAIESTPSGNGYWIISGSGKVYNFGDAPVGPQAEIYVTDEMIPNVDTFFEALIHDFVRNDVGTGYYVLRADGTVQSLNTPDLGGIGQVINQPYDGNYKDLLDIVKDLLLWGGWLLYDEEDPEPHVYGQLESTAMMSPTPLSSDTFDKRSLFDCINTIKEIVAYVAYVDDEGAFRFESPNIWRPGNFLNGQRMNLLHEIDEEKLLTDYVVTLDGEPLRSQIIIAALEPNVHDPNSTQFTSYSPVTTSQLRGIHRPMMFLNEFLNDPSDQKTMAELIALRIWFSQRVGSITMISHPGIQIDDQIRVYERNTSETYIHYVRAIDHSHDLDTGEAKMTLQTNWLGDGNNWAITAGDLDAGTLEQYRVSTSYALDRLNGGDGTSTQPPLPTEPPTGPSDPPPPVTTGVLWRDDFSGDSLDLNKWGVHNNDHYGDAGGTHHTTRSQNVIVSNGTLKLRAKRETYMGEDFTTGVIGTRDHSPPILYPAYLRVEGRLRAPHGQGLWPSLWMRHGNGASTGETDIFEYFHAENPGKNSSTIYLDGHGARNKSVSAPNSKTGNRIVFFETPTLTPAWHTWGVTIRPVAGTESSPTAVEWAFDLDGAVYHTYTERQYFDWVNDTGDIDHVWDVILDLYIDGDYIGNPDGNLAYSDETGNCLAGGSNAGGGLSCTLPTNIMRAGYTPATSLRSGQLANFGDGIDFEIDYIEVEAV